MNVVVIGHHDSVPYLLQVLGELDECHVSGVVTSATNSITRERIEEASDSKSELLAADSINDASAKQFLRQCDIDVGVCFGWYEIISPDVIELPPRGILGIHAAPLPEGRGQAPVNWQLIYGFDEATVSVFELVESVDAGPIHGQRSVPILEDETASSLYDRLVYYGIEELRRALQDLAAGSPSVRHQSLSEATYWPERRPEDGLIDWGLPANTLDRVIRALVDPYPSAFTYVDGRKVQVERASALEASTGRDPGDVASIEPPTGLHVQTGDGVLALERLGFDGVPAISGSEFAEEHGIRRGDTIGTRSHFPEAFMYTALRGPEGRQHLSLETNVTLGETARNHAYCFVPGGERELSITVRLGGKEVTREHTVVSGHESIPVECTPQSPGAQFLEVAFGDRDVRTAYLYVHEEPTTE